MPGSEVKMAFKKEFKMEFKMAFKMEFKRPLNAGGPARWRTS